MVEDAKTRKREQVAMRAEDKYTEENDPVESQERRFKRQQEDWRVANADDLKDDAKEHALGCLKSEKEGNTQKEEPLYTTPMFPSTPEPVSFNESEYESAGQIE